MILSISIRDFSLSYIKYTVCGANLGLLIFGDIPVMNHIVTQARWSISIGVSLHLHGRVTRYRSATECRLAS